MNLINNQALDLPPSKNREHGIGLIEILIAVVIMSMGFLAAARMQVEGMRFSQSAYYQSQAHFMANDMIDRMRSNIQGVIEQEYAGMTTTDGITKPNCSSANNPCTPSVIADLDRWEWSASLHPLANATGFIPALYSPASGVITRIVVPDNDQAQRYSIVMSWTELVQGNNENQSLNIQFELETRE
ncbi:MAG: type IV pilus assembly protein PilV [Granulosicoccus sp.]